MIRDFLNFLFPLLIGICIGLLIGIGLAGTAIAKILYRRTRHD